eukprot:gene9310-1577_t
MSFANNTRQDESLNKLFESAMEHLQKVYKGNMKEIDRGISLVERAATFLLQLNVFGENEEHTEHSTISLRYLALPFIHAELLSRKFPVDLDPEDRDKERLHCIYRCCELYRQFIENLRDMEFPFAPPTVVNYYLNLSPGARRERDSKISHLKATKAAEAMLEKIENVIKNKDLDEDDETQREHVMTLLHWYLLKACDQIESLGVEHCMLENVIKMREAGEDPRFSRETPKPQTDRPEPPLVLTSDLVKASYHFRNCTAGVYPCYGLWQIAVSGKTIDRSNFKLLTRGYGPIGEPTMSLAELAEIEMKEAREVAGRQREAEAKEQAIDPDSEEVCDAETYKAREYDEWKDSHRRGEGNRYNMG